MNQEHKRPERRQDEENEWDVVPEDMPKQQNETQIADDDIDAILDEIDSALEGNAEEFVRGFVQKGGQ